MKYLVHADGKLPNLALMRLSTYFKSRGARTRLIRASSRRQPSDQHGEFFGSTIFSKSKTLRDKIEDEWFPLTYGGIVWGGTGVDIGSSLSSVDPDVVWDSIRPDYSIYPHFEESIGFLTRGCRLRCGFCVVPQKEGKPYTASSVHDIYRGEPYPRHLHLLDNDAFAPQLADWWKNAVAEIRAGGFKVCFSQGINLRLVNEESAAIIATLPLCSTGFDRPGLYTAWDSIGDESIFKRGISMLRAAGANQRFTVFMLVGYNERETWEDRFYRFAELRALGNIDPYPMVFNKSERPDLAAFQKWAVGFSHGRIPWPTYTPNGQRPKALTPEICAESDAAWQRVVGGWKPKRLTVVA